MLILCYFHRELREETNQLSNRESDHMAKRKDMEQRHENAQTEILSLKNDLRLALQRIADLQQAMEDVDDEDDGTTERLIFFNKTHLSLHLNSNSLFMFNVRSMEKSKQFQ